MSHHFISYSTADGLDFARKLHDALEGGTPSRPAWLDKEDLKGGIDWDVQLNQAIRDCATLLFVMTPDSVTDESGCKPEWVSALKYKKHIVPLRLDPGAELPFRLSSRNFIDFTKSFEAGLAQLRQHLDWLKSPDGELHKLRERLKDAERDLVREFDATRRARIETDIRDLRESIARQEAILRDPQAAAEQTRRSVEAGIERERQPEKPVTGQSHSKFINPPPGEAPPYFAGREAETRLLASFMKNDNQRLFTLIGRGGVGKTALVCRLLKSLERGELPDGLGSLTVDGIVYLSENGSRRITVDNLLGDLSKLLTGPAAAEAAKLLQNPALATEAKVRGLLTHFDAAGGRVVLLLDNAEDLLDEVGKFKDAELFEALRTLLKAVNRFKIILTSRVRPHELLLVEPARQANPREITDGLESPHAEAILRALDDTGELGLKDAPDALLNQARIKTRGFPRALEALVAILRADRYTTLAELLERDLPENVTETLVGEAFARLEPSAQAVLQVLAVYGRPVTPVAVDYVLHPFHETADSARLLKRLAAMHFVRAEAGKFFLHPVDRAYALGRLPAGEDSDRHEAGEPVFSRIGLAMLAADFFKTQRIEESQWKKLEDLRPQLDEFDLRCESEDWDTAANILIEIDSYIRLWGYARLVIVLHESLQNRPLSETLTMVRTAKLAQAYSDLGRYHLAVTSLNEALLMAQLLKELRAKGIILGTLGSCYSQMGQYAQAIDYHEQALAISREVGDRANEGATLSNLGSCYDRLGQHVKAIEYLEQALVINHEVGDRINEGTTLGNLGSCYGRLGQHAKAIEYHERALAIIHAIRNRAAEGTTLGNLGLCYSNIGQYTKAIEYHEQALAISREVGDRAGEGVTLSNLGLCYSNLGQAAKAIEYHEQALAISREIGLRAIEGSVLGYLGTCYMNLGQTAKATEYHEQALAISREVRDRAEEGSILGNLGFCYYNLGQYYKAIEYNEQALAIKREVGDRAEEGGILGQLGFCYNMLGQFNKAILYHEQALAIIRERRDRIPENAILSTLGLFNSSLGQYAKSIEYHEQALAIKREVGDRAGEGIDLGNLGLCYGNLGQIAKAIEYHEQALAIKLEVGDRAGEGATLGNLGGCYSDLGQYAKAIEYAQSALIIARETGYRVGEAAFQRRWGYAALLQADWTEATAHYQESLIIADGISASRLQHIARWGLALVGLYTDDLAEARARIDSALTFDEPQNTQNAQNALGVIALRQRDSSTAREAFTHALAHSEILIGYADQNYRAWDARCIALAGLALLATDPTDCESHRAGARAAFAKARSITDAPGVVTGVRQLLAALKLADTDGVLGDL